MGKPRPKYTAELKRRAVQPYNEGGGTAYAEVAREIGVGPSSLADRVGRAPAAAPDAEASPFQTAEDLRRLRRENERLKRESEMLSKASAFLAGRQPQAPGRRRRGYRQESCALFRQPHKPAVRCGYPSSRVTSR